MRSVEARLVSTAICELDVDRPKHHPPRLSDSQESITLDKKIQQPQDYGAGVSARENSSNKLIGGDTCLGQMAVVMPKFSGDT